MLVFQHNVSETHHARRARGMTSVSYDQRYGVLEQLLHTWWAPLSREQQVTAAELTTVEVRLGRCLPRALHDWFHMAGRRDDCFGGDDHPLAPDHLRLEDQMLIFAVENQGLCAWGIPLATLDQPDPPVLIDTQEWTGQPGQTTPNWEAGHMTVTEFLLGMVLEATWYHVQFAAEGSLPLLVLTDVAHHYPTLVPQHPVLGTLYGSTDCLIHVAPNDEDGAWPVRVLVRTQARFEDVLRQLGRTVPEREHRIRQGCHPYTHHCQELASRYIDRALRDDGQMVQCGEPTDE